jgi:hypothetical protein
MCVRFPMHAYLPRIYPDSFAIITISRQAAKSNSQFKPYLAGCTLLSGTGSSKSTMGIGVFLKSAQLASAR